jgi:site-specific DNA recombinase
MPKAKSRTAKRALPLDAYVRVSKVGGRNGDSFISPDVQRDRIAAWAQARDRKVNALAPELDVSGGTVDRPVLNEAIRRVEEGESGGIVVWRLDRFGRTLIDSLSLIRRIREAGATFASVEDGFDLSTPAGRLAMKVMLSLGEYELERITDTFEESRRRAVGRGLHLTPTVPFGYRRACSRCGADAIEPGNGNRRSRCRACGAEGGGKLEPDPETGPLIAELFDRRANGEGWADLSRWMESTGAKTQRGRSIWSLRALRDIIRNDVYLGVAEHGEFRREGAHEPLVDEPTWRRAQRRGSQTRSRAKEPALLGGLLRCSGCRHVMAAKTQKLADGRLLHQFRCRQAEGHGKGSCQAWASLSGVEALELAEQLRAGLEERAHLRARAARASDYSLAAARTERARATLAEYAADHGLQERIGWEAYQAGFDARTAAVADAETAEERERDQQEAEAVLPEPEHLDQQAWSGYTVEERRSLLASGIGTVFIRRRSSRDEPLVSRIHVRWHGMPAVDLPGKGRRDYTPRPFLFDSPGDVGAPAVQDSQPSGGD